MRRENLKNILLTILIVNCLYLTGQICFNKKFWNENYNVWTMISESAPYRYVTNIFNSKNTNLTDNLTFSKIAKPSQIVFANGSNRKIHFRDTDEYNVTLQKSSNVLKKAFESKNIQIETISKKEWLEVLSAKSIFVNYEVDINSQIIGKMIEANADNITSTISSFSSYTISASAVTGNLVIGINSNDTYYNIYLNYPDGDIINYINDATKSTTESYQYSFELGFDKDIEKVPKIVTIDPSIMLPLEQKVVPKIAVTNIINEENINELSSKIVECFGYTPSSLRKTILPNKSISFIENTGTVKINPDGVVEFTTPAKGISLKHSGTNNYQYIDNTLKIINKILYTLHGENMPQYKISSDVTVQDEKVILKLNYLYNGVMVVSEDEEVAIQAEIYEGNLVYLKMKLLNISPTVGTETTMGILDALDAILAHYNKEIYISELAQVYRVDNGETKSSWYAKIANEEHSIVLK